MQKLMFDIDGPRFVDTHGRHALLRGVNLGGDSKLPWSDGGAGLPTDFADHREVSFVGRPFPLADADEHLSRIKGWGFNVLRLLTTWEAVEHAGPGLYDEAYLDYFAAICARAGDHGLAVIVDFHQDVWSRMTGGDGAPGWVFEAVGLDMTAFDAAGAVHVMQHRYDYGSTEARQEDRYPMMSWPRNYQMPVNGVMWTAFFAGATLTPEWRVGDADVQTFLQEAYLGAVSAVAARVAHLDNVIGFDSLNEPGLGWVGMSLSRRRLAPDADNATPIWPGPSWTPLDSLKVASGLSVTLPVMARSESGMVVTGQEVVNPHRRSIWLQDGPDPFEVAGAWARQGDDGAVIDDDFFRCRDGRRFDHSRDFMLPFFDRVATTIRAVRPDWLLFAEMCPYGMLQGKTFPPSMPARTVNASHWYDIDILGSKRFDPDGPLEAHRERYGFQLRYVQAMGDAMREGGAPSLVGEFGIPCDLNGGDAFARWHAGDRGDEVWRAHATALGLMYDVMDQRLLSSTQWNYTVTNSNDLRVGDGWNQEDLSIWSADQTTTPGDPASGARGISGFSRPYGQRAQGVIQAMSFDDAGATFRMRLDVDPGITAPTEIFVPGWRFPDGVRVAISDLEATWTHDLDDQIVRVHTAHAGLLEIILTAVGT